MRVLVTGGSGFVGSHLVEALLAQGDAVACLLRRPLARTWLNGLPVTPFHGDLTDPSSLPDAAKEVEVVYHLAGQLRNSGFHRVNAVGTENLVEALRRHAPGLKRFVFVSSLAAQGPCITSDRPVTEDDPPRPVSGYGRSKLEAEKAAHVLASSCPVIVLRPSIVYGPRDQSLLALIRTLARGIQPPAPVPNQKVSLIYIVDLVQAILLAGRAGASGTFLLSDGAAYATEDLLCAIAWHLHVRPIKVPIPRMLLALGALIADAWAATSGRSSILSRDKYREMIQPGWVVDIRRARETLGFDPQFTLDRGLDLAIDWYRAQGWIPASHTRTTTPPGE